jgi:hypothetical protein
VLQCVCNHLRFISVNYIIILNTVIGHKYSSPSILCYIFRIKPLFLGRRGRDSMVVAFTTTYAISAYHHWCCEFESRSGRGVQHYVIKFVSDLRQVGVFSGYSRVRVMVFNATFNNISVKSWQSVLLVEETGVPWENTNLSQVTNRDVLYALLYQLSYLKSLYN